MVGKVAAYETTMRDALAKNSSTPAAGAAATPTMTREQFDVLAREQLSAIANKPVNDEVVNQVNALLGVDPSTLSSTTASTASSASTGAGSKTP